MKLSCKGCKFCTECHWTNPHTFLCALYGEVFLVNPSNIPPCLNYKPKPEYIPKECETDENKEDN